MLFLKKTLIVSAVALLAGSPLTHFVAYSPAYAKEAKPLLEAGIVAVPDKYAALAAEEIMRAGGNAVDAAVAIGFSLAVTYPEAGNLGGGGFMTLFFDGKPYFLDYREVAPSGATRTMYLDEKGDIIPNMSTIGHRSVGVPGTVKGLWEVHHRFGKLPWKRVMAPAIRYAHHGFTVSNHLIERRDTMLKDFEGKTNFSKYFGAMQAGQLFRQPLLEKTLGRIARNGEKEFYEGETAQLLATEMQGKGLITRQDLKQYQARWREPIQADWNGYRIITAPPPSSGGLGLVQLLKMKEKLNAAFKDVPLNSAQYIHLLAEIEKRVFADRAEYLGDPDFHKVPLAKLISDEYLMQRAQEVDIHQLSVTENVKPGLPEGDHTTHFSIVDKWGNAISNTYTLNSRFGSGVVVEGAGFLLNNEMDDFSSKPGVANRFGVVGKDANAITPGKRMLSSMTPTILTQNGQVALVIGTPGGSRIFTSVFQVINNIYDFKMTLGQAVSEMRVHHQLLPANTIYWEPYKPIDGKVAETLEARGYTLKQQKTTGDIQVIQITDSIPIGASDPRARGITNLIP